MHLKTKDFNNAFAKETAVCLFVKLFLIKMLKMKIFIHKTLVKKTLIIFLKDAIHVHRTNELNPKVQGLATHLLHSMLNFFSESHG